MRCSTRAAGFARSRGMKTLSGPMNLSTNHDCGVLVEGFDFPPAMMMPYNFRYYGALLEGWGLRKMNDLYAYDLSTALAPPEKVVRVAERLRSGRTSGSDPSTSGNLPEEIRRLKSIYNAMMDRAWLFLPLSEEEFDGIVRDSGPWSGCGPSSASSRRSVASRRPSPSRCRTPTAPSTPPAGTSPAGASGGARTDGLGRARQSSGSASSSSGSSPGSVAGDWTPCSTWRPSATARRLGYDGAELGWVTEDNELMNRAIESMGARRYKTYRIYERPL